MNRKHYVYNRNYYMWGIPVEASMHRYAPWTSVCGICNVSVDYPSWSWAMANLEAHVRVMHTGWLPGHKGREDFK